MIKPDVCSSLPQGMWAPNYVEAFSNLVGNTMSMQVDMSEQVKKPDACPSLPQGMWAPSHARRSVRSVGNDDGQPVTAAAVTISATARRGRTATGGARPQAAAECSTAAGGLQPGSSAGRAAV